MKRFVFRLETLGKLLSSRQRSHQLALVQAIDGQTRAQAKVVDIRDARTQAMQLPSATDRVVHPHSRQELTLYLHSTDQALEEAQRTLDTCSRAVESARGALHEARTEVRRMERLRELHETQHRTAEKKREVARMDELGSLRQED